MTKIAILGSGMAGFGAAHQLYSEGIRPAIFDKRPFHGGHTASFTFDNGFTIDEGPHVSFTGNSRLKELFERSVGGEVIEHKARVNNYWKGHWIKHPAQCNLHGLPADLVTKVIEDFVQASSATDKEVHNYEEWLRAQLGNTFATTFPMEYTVKYHTTVASNMSTDWLGPRLYRPKLSEVLRGALAADTEDVHYITNFRYPTQGGFVAFLNLFLDQADLRLSHEVTAIDHGAKRLFFANEKEAEYDELISSVPLPDLVPMIAGAPDDVIEASQRLACTEVVIVSIGIDRQDIIDAHWTYFYDRDFFLTRLSTPHLQSPNNVPPGCGSVQAECYYSKKYRPLDREPEDCVEPVITDLRRCGLLRDDDNILFKHAMHIPYANVIFDLERADALACIHGFLDDIGIAYCGRYGEWGYLWTDQSFISGERSARSVLDSLGSDV